MICGGLHGSVSIALAISVPHNFPHRATLLTLCFGIVEFSIVVQGLALSAASLELEHLGRMKAVSAATFETLSKEMEQRSEDLAAELTQIQASDPPLAAERSALQRGVIEGLVPPKVNEHLRTDAAREVDRLSSGPGH